MRRPAPETLEDIRHPGPRADERRPFAHCQANAVTFEIGSDRPLLEALGNWAEAEEYCSAVLDLGGLSLSAFDYVMPDRAIDDRHAAWYSDIHSSGRVTLNEAVAILGWRDGVWFAHIHAYWQEAGSSHLGHLLPHTLTTGRKTFIRGFGLKGAKFEAALDPETEFTLFRVKEDADSRSDQPPNALITTLAPLEDLHDSVQGLAQHLSGKACDIYGLGSLAGAKFKNAAPMRGLISEILLQNTSLSEEDKNVQLPVRAVDLHGTLHEGTLLPGGAPTLVTCELLLTVKNE
jgi:hypothetical protein